MGFDFAGQVKGQAPSLWVVGPDLGLFYELTSYPCSIYFQCDFPGPAGVNGPVVTGQGAPSGRGDTLDVESCLSFVRYHKSMF